MSDWSVLSPPPSSLSSLDAGGFETHPTIPLIERHATVCTKADYLALDPQTTHIVVPNNCSNEPDFTAFVMTPFPFLRELTIGNNCFKNIMDFIVTGLGGLRKITIGDGSFSQSQEDLQELGAYLRIKDCPALDPMVDGADFYFADFELKSEREAMCSGVDVPHLKTLILGTSSFHDAEKVTFESGGGKRE